MPFSNTQKETLKTEVYYLQDLEITQKMWASKWSYSQGYREEGKGEGKRGGETVYMPESCFYLGLKWGLGFCRLILYCWLTNKIIKYWKPNWPQSSVTSTSIYKAKSLREGRQPGSLSSQVSGNVFPGNPVLNGFLLSKHMLDTCITYSKANFQDLRYPTDNLLNPVFFALLAEGLDKWVAMSTLEEADWLW